MKVQRYEVLGHAYAGEWCKSEDVDLLEQEHLDLMGLHETIMRGAPIEVIRREAEELQKRFLENRP